MAVMIVASVITVTDNGLAFTAIAEIAEAVLERAGHSARNAGRLLATGLTPPLFGALITAAGYPAAFLVCALFPVLAIPLVPADQPGRPTEPRESGQPV